MPLSLDFLLEPKVDKGKRRAGSEVAAVAQAGAYRRSSKGVEADVDSSARPLKRSRTTTDTFSSPPPLSTTRSLSLLPEPSTRAIPQAGPSAAEKKAAEQARAKAIKAVDAERAKADKAREKEREKARVLEERAQRKRDQEVNKVGLQCFRVCAAC